MKTYSFRAIIEPDDPKRSHGYVPILKGVHTSGDTIPEVRKNLRQAIKCHIEGFMKAGESIPTFSTQEFSAAYA